MLMLPVSGSGFLSTPSARRATPAAVCPLLLVGNFYPRPPRGGRHLGHAAAHIVGSISIHALREEGDMQGLNLIQGKNISIHALREEGDRKRGKTL